MSRVLIVGAGVAGLLAGQALRSAGHDVVVLDKGRVPGGRLATRTVDDAVFDTGAQFLTTKSERFRTEVAGWTARGTAGVWFHGSPDELTPTDPDGHPRYRGRPTMRALATDVARGLDVRLATVVDGVSFGGSEVHLTTHRRVDDDHTPGGTSSRSPDQAAAAAQGTEVLAGDALLLTPPLPQSLALLDASEVALPSAVDGELRAITYDPCLAVLAVPDGPTSLPSRGGMRLLGQPVGWLTDNHATGASPVPAITIHASPDRSRELWDADEAIAAAAIAEDARPHLGTGARAVYLHRWRYAAPRSRASSDAVVTDHLGVPVAFAGDGLVGGRVEGAALSGWAAAQQLLDALPDAAAA
jgi:renalase